MECPSRKVQLLGCLKSSLDESEVSVSLASLRGFFPPGSKLFPDDRSSKSLNSSIGGWGPRALREGCPFFRKPIGLFVSLDLLVARYPSDADVSYGC